MARTRLDQLLVQRGLAESREKAQRLIRAGQVNVDGKAAAKPGHLYPDESDISLSEGERFVSRGGHKLEAAFEQFPIEVEGKVCLDVGASTGGFTDCLLQHGAKQVYAVDVGKGQLHWNLRKDPRVIPMESVNARRLEPEAFDPRPTFAVIDVSFISLTKILPAVKQALTESSELVTLIKPQFEAGRKQVLRGGVVRDPAVHEEVVDRIRQFGSSVLGLEWKGIIPSPVKGPKGNIEFLAYWKIP